MFSALEAIGDGWRAIVHVSEWSGLSLGALAGLAALFYFVPLARKIAIVLAFDVLLIWGSLVHGHKVGIADEDAKLKTMSDQGDTRAATAANTDETALVASIEAKAKEQHDADVATINGLQSGAAGCAFDPDGDDGGLRAPAGPVPTGAVNRNPKPAGSAKPPYKSAAGAATRPLLQLPLVWRSWLQGKGPSRNAAPDGK